MGSPPYFISTFCENREFLFLRASVSLLLPRMMLKLHYTVEIINLYVVIYHLVRKNVNRIVSNQAIIFLCNSNNP